MYAGGGGGGATSGTSGIGGSGGGGAVLSLVPVHQEWQTPAVAVVAGAMALMVVKVALVSSLLCIWHRGKTCARLPTKGTC